MRSVIAAMAFVLTVQPLAAQGRAADESALRERVAAFEAAINTRNYPVLAALYDADADLIVIDGPLVAGRTSIQAATQRDWSSSPTRRISLQVTNIRFLGNDVALINTRAQFNEGTIREDRGTWLASRQSGQWLISALRVLPAAKQ
jgi:uncharacterized protein (TIGR02246 family)